MENTVKRIEQKQKRELIIIISIGVLIMLGIFIFVYFAKDSQKHGSILDKRLEIQNKQLEKQNVSLLKTVEKLNLTIEESVARDSALLNITNEQLKLLPGIDYKVTSIKKDYEKDAINYRNLDARAVESYITAEAARLRNE